MKLGYEYYYKESYINGRLVVERGYVNYEHIEKALKERAKIIVQKRKELAEARIEACRHVEETWTKCLMEATSVPVIPSTLCPAACVCVNIYLTVSTGLSLYDFIICAPVVTSSGVKPSCVPTEPAWLTASNCPCKEVTCCCKSFDLVLS